MIEVVRLHLEASCPVCAEIGGRTWSDRTDLSEADWVEAHRAAAVEVRVDGDRVVEVTRPSPTTDDGFHVCSVCGRLTTEVCRDVVCRACHKTESLEDCLDDKQVNAMRARYGLPPIDGGGRS